jgi:predicted kinase
MTPALIVLSGLPGAGKTTIANELARRFGAVHIRIDVIEQALRNAGIAVEAEGYLVGYALAEHHLRAGRMVVADSVNPWPETRAAWRHAASASGARALDVEVVCSDAAAHRQRVESRTADIRGHRVPAWTEVVERDYRAWDRDRLVIDTNATSAEEAARAILSAVTPPRRLLVLTGSMGAGKSTILAEISDLLAARDIVHAAIDADTLSVAHPPRGTMRIMDTNLAAVIANYAAAGIDRFIVAEALETRASLNGLIQIAGASDAITCRLRAPVRLMRDRVRTREQGILTDAYVARVEVLERLLDHASVEDFSVSTDGRTVTDVAFQVLQRAGWVTA